MGEPKTTQKNSVASGKKEGRELSPRVVEMQKRLGKRIRSLREGRGLTQENLSSLAGFTQKYLGEVERGTGNITIELLTKLADALVVPLAEIMENDHERTKDELVAEIIRMAPKLNEKDVQIVYRMLTLMTHG